MSEKDNTELKPAEENPWYVLATIYNQDIMPVEGTMEFQYGLNAIRSRQAWNSWAISKLNDKQKKFIREKKPDILDESPQWDSIKKDVQKRLQKLGIESIPPLELAMDMSSLKFVDDAHFANFIFPVKVSFCESQFERSSGFKGAFFFGHADFGDVIFFDQAIFQESNFADSSFTRTVFAQESFFTDTSFIGVNFIGAQFKGNSFYVGAKFQDYSFFDGCQFKKPCNFRKAKFEKSYPIFEGVTFHEKSTVTAKKEFWPNHKKCEQDPEPSKDSCANLRHLMNTQGLPEKAHFFFRREMHFASKIGSIWQRLPFLLFGWLSDYGHSLKRPIWALAILWFFPTVIFWVNICTGKCANTIGAELWISLTKMAGLSIANIFQITGLQRVYWSDFIECLPWGLKFLGGAQTLLAIPLLFLLLLGLRNRFRLK
jgi:uncharacterized protein YjbI with pentapeptide repeats